MGVFQKLCCGCSADVAEKVRVKDQEGRYFCQTCFETKTRSKMPQAAFAGFGSPPPAASRSAPQMDSEPIELDDSYEVAIVEHLTAAPRPSKSKEEVFGCADCKKLVTQRQIRNDDGDFVCIPCFTKRRKNATADPVYATPVRRKSFAEEDGVSDALPFHYSFLGGSLISFGILAFNFLAFLAIQLFAPTIQRSLPAGIAFGIVYAIFETFYVLVSAGILIFSLLMVSRILGGCDLGSFGCALWKSVFASCIFALVVYFLDRLGLFFLFRFSVLGLFLYVLYMWLFGLDSFEAGLLTFINYVISWGLAIVLAIMLLKVAAALNHTSAAAPSYDRKASRIAVIDLPHPVVRNPAA